MKDDKIAQHVKNVIMQELGINEKSRKSIIDIFLHQPKEFIMLKEKLSKVTINFLNTCERKLRAENESGNIEFFKIYNYEKILNTYLEKIYSTQKLEMEQFPSQEKLENEQEKLRKKEEEIRKEKQESVRKEQVEKEQVEKILIEEMSNACKLSIPLVVDSVSSYRWSDGH